jgi:hypothetical protein
MRDNIGGRANTTVLATADQPRPSSQKAETKSGIGCRVRELSEKFDTGNPA